MVIEEIGNPSLESGNELLVLDTKEIASENVIGTVHNIEQNGKEQYEDFVKERIMKREKSISDPIHLNKLALFGTQRKTSTKGNQSISSLKENCALFSQLYISCASG